MRGVGCYHDGTMMQRLMIQAEPELVERTKRRAAERGVSVAQVVREALGHELGDDSEQPLFSMVGALRSGRSDLSRLASEDIFYPAPWRTSRARRSWLPRGELIHRLIVARADPGLREDLARLVGETTDDLGPLA
jgi:hypothetical protein